MLIASSSSSTAARLGAKSSCDPDEKNAIRASGATLLLGTFLSAVRRAVRNKAVENMVDEGFYYLFAICCCLIATSNLRRCAVVEPEFGLVKGNARLVVRPSWRTLFTVSKQHIPY
jgi:hypothetical protein